MKTNNIYILLLLLISALTYWQDFTSSDSFDTILTIQSILLGFALTALSVVATSSYSKVLYNIEKKGDNSKTLLHELIYNFKLFIYWLLISSISILMFKYFDMENNSWAICCVNVPSVIASVIWGLSIVSFIIFIPLVKVFMAFIIKSASHQD